MKRLQAKRGCAFSRTDLLGVVAFVVLLAALLWPVLALSRAKAHRARCLSNLKEITRGCRLWANANSGHLPWALALTNGGTLGTADWAAHYRVFSNEFGSPKVLVCPSDLEKTIAISWAALDGERNVSFFAGLDADESKPQTIVAGDRNIRGGGRGLELSWSRDMGASIDATWQGTIHVNQGDIALADGSAQSTRSPALREQISAALQSGNPTVTFSLPRGPLAVPPPR